MAPTCASRLGVMSTVGAVVDAGAASSGASSSCVTGPLTLSPSHSNPTYNLAVTDWATISALATAGGTLVLAGATFAAVRSGNRAARANEMALLAGIRPVLLVSRMEDPMQKVLFIDDHVIKLEGGRGVAEVVDDIVYLGIPLRNVGSGLAVLDRWDFYADRMRDDPHTDLNVFRRLNRDLYVPAGDLGFWQGAFRDRSEPGYAVAREAVEARKTITIDILYGDHEGGQRTISRFALIPREDGQWIATVARHWNLDRADPR
jgi:hypothetical protein